MINDNLYGMTIGDKHTYDDFGLILTDYYMPEPEPKIERIDLPFSSGTIDLTDSTGVTPYDDRKNLEFKFQVIDGTRERFASLVQRLSMHLHGKYLKMIPDHELSYYYMVRLSVDSVKTNPRTSTIVLKGVADPFKYDSVASNEPWLWDPFNFETGVIQDTSDITVNGTKTVHIRAGGVPTCPEFFVSNINTTLSVTFEGTEYKFANGANRNYRFPQIRISSENADLIFRGNGKVSVSYRGRFL